MLLCTGQDFVCATILLNVLVWTYNYLHPQNRIIIVNQHVCTPTVFIAAAFVLKIIIKV